MKEKSAVSMRHPRAESLRIRERLVKSFEMGIVVGEGLIAHGRGEAFDYLLGEKTVEPALTSLRAAAAMLLTAKHPVISVNGNAAALVAEDIVKLAKVVGAKIEVNLFHPSAKRKKAIKKMLEGAGAVEVLGVDKEAAARISEVASERRRVDARGIFVADVVLVPLEDGDRTEALVKMGKKVIAIDLNPLSRTAQFASVTIVDNIVRAMPMLVKIAEELKTKPKEALLKILANFDNKKVLGEAIGLINKRLSELAQKGVYIKVS